MSSIGSQNQQHHARIILALINQTSTIDEIEATSDYSHHEIDAILNAAGPDPATRLQTAWLREEADILDADWSARDGASAPWRGVAAACDRIAGEFERVTA